MTLTLADFATWYNSTSTTPFSGNTAEVEFLLGMYQEEIANVVPIEKTNATKLYTFDTCNQFYLACPTWESYTVESGLRSDIANFTTLTANKDFIPHNSYFDNKIIGLDFSCLRSNCKCEVIQITGTYGYKLQDNLIKLIFRLIAKLLSQECCDQISDLTSIKVGSISKSYSVDIEQVNQLRELKNGFGISQYAPVKTFLSRYKLELIII
jgi:hypothetical protein